MSTQQWDPARQAYIYYDDTYQVWRRVDGLPLDTPPPANQAEPDEDAQHPFRQPRYSGDPQRSLAESQQSAFYGSSPTSSGSHYQHDSSHDRLSDAFANLNVHGEPSQTHGDVTPRPPIHYGEVKREPKHEVTDPSLYKRGMTSHGKIKATPGDKERLDPDFKRQRHPKEFFVPGKVFRILWPEHPGYRTENVTVITDGGGYRGQDIITKFRWFVVVKSGDNFCSCLPISTYNRRGLTKMSLRKSQHSVIFSGKEEPPLLLGEEPAEGEAGMMPWIRVVPKRQGDKMDTRSRLDYSRVYTVDHFVKVKEFGDVHKTHVKRLRKQWWLVFKESMKDEISDSEGEEEAEADWVVAWQAYNERPDMMQLWVGDRIRVTDYTTEAWWKGVNERTGIENLFPASYVRRESAS